MMTPPPKPPPRFIPTLTEVVQMGGTAALPVSAPTPAATVVRPPLPSLATALSSPPSEDVTVRPAVSLPSDAPARPIAQDAAMRPGPTVAQETHRAAKLAAPPPSMPEGMEEFMVHRVMQRVDVMLEKRLRDAIATVVQEQTRSVLPRLREEIESVVRHSVYEAMAEELASGQTHNPVG